MQPGAFKEHPGSLGNKYWPSDLPFDPSYPSLDGLEWLVDDAEAVQVTGLMVREFGPQACELFGSTAKSVTKGPRGPEFEWTRLRQEELAGSLKTLV